MAMAYPARNNGLSLAGRELFHHAWKLCAINGDKNSTNGRFPYDQSLLSSSSFWSFSASLAASLAALLSNLFNNCSFFNAMFFARNRE